MELIVSVIVGRYAPLAAVITVGVVANLLMTLLIIAAVVAQISKRCKGNRKNLSGMFSNFLFLQSMINTGRITTNLLTISPFRRGILMGISNHRTVFRSVAADLRNREFGNVDNLYVYSIIMGAACC